MYLRHTIPAKTLVRCLLLSCRAIQDRARPAGQGRRSGIFMGCILHTHDAPKLERLLRKESLKWIFHHRMRDSIIDDPHTDTFQYAVPRPHLPICPSAHPPVLPSSRLSVTTQTSRTLLLDPCHVVGKT
ncbi:hypothetical protein F4779DRAFT_205925 [Xylariaceae sp. FL0662B]|nr:hypothetical protein F4779DRAFT_205925 [Xylariaceae sp. FL0662B]